MPVKQFSRICQYKISSSSDIPVHTNVESGSMNIPVQLINEEMPVQKYLVEYASAKDSIGKHMSVH
jgi:hypothetical protein